VLTKTPSINNDDKIDEINKIFNSSSKDEDRLQTIGLGLLVIPTAAIIVKYLEVLQLQYILSVQIDMKCYILFTVIIGTIISSFQLSKSESEQSIDVSSSSSLIDEANNGIDDDTSSISNMKKKNPVFLSVFGLLFLACGIAIGVISRTFDSIDEFASIQIDTYGYILLTSIIAGITSYYFTNKLQDES